MGGPGRAAGEQRAGRDADAAAVLAAPPATAVAHGARETEEVGAGLGPWQVGPGCQPPLLLFSFHFKWLKPSKKCKNL